MHALLLSFLCSLLFSLPPVGQVEELSKELREHKTARTQQHEELQTLRRQVSLGS